MQQLSWVLALIVALVLGPRATAVQGSTALCTCVGGAETTYNFLHPCIHSATQFGTVGPGRCHRGECTMAAKPCKAALTWIVDAKPGCVPIFEWRLNGVTQPGGKTDVHFECSLSIELVCGEGQLVEILANGEQVLNTVITCMDCAE
jgi:hypothetical protein